MDDRILNRIKNFTPYPRVLVQDPRGFGLKLGACPSSWIFGGEVHHVGLLVDECPTR